MAVVLQDLVDAEMILLHLLLGSKVPLIVHLEARHLLLHLKDDLLSSIIRRYGVKQLLLKALILYL